MSSFRILANTLLIPRNSSSINPPASIPITSNETVSKEDLKERKAKRLKANQRSKKGV